MFERTLPHSRRSRQDQPNAQRHEHDTEAQVQSERDAGAGIWHGSGMNHEKVNV